MIVVVPEGTPAPVVTRFVVDRHDWIARARSRVAAEARALAVDDGPEVPDRLHLRAIGARYRVEGIEGGRGGVDCADGCVRVRPADDPPALRAALATWLKDVAREHIVPRLGHLADQHGLSYQRTTVRGQRTRWASCSGRGTISLNYKLLFLPPNLVDHVLLHELAHTCHLNHSSRFWRLLSRLDPDWEAHHAELSRANRWLPHWVEMDG